MLKQDKVRKNLIVMIMVFLSAAIDYILLYCSIEMDNKYEKATISAITDIVGIAFSLLVSKRFAASRGDLSIMFGIACFGAVMMSA